MATKPWDQNWGRDPRSPADFPVESAAERDEAARRSLNIMVSERGPGAHPSLEAEIQRTSTQLGEAPPASAAPAVSPAGQMPWEMDWGTETAAAEAPATNPWEMGWEAEQPNFWRQLKNTIVGGLQQGVGGVVQAIGEKPSYLSAVEEAARTNRPIAEVEAEMAEKAKDSTLAKAGAGIAESGRIEAEEADLENAGFWRRAAVGGLGSLAQNIPWMALGIATRSPAPIMGGASAQTFGQSYAEGRDKGLEVDEALRLAGNDAAVEGLMEMIPAKFLVDSTSKTMGKLILGTLVREQLTEIPTTILQSVNAETAGIEDLSADDYWQRVLDTAGATLFAGGGAGVVAGGMRALRQPPATEQFVAPGLEQSVEPVVNDAVNGPITTPSFDQPTIPLDSLEKETLSTEILNIDPDSITEEQLEQDRLVIEEAEKKSAKPAMEGSETVWTALSASPQSAVDIGELSASRKQAANAPNYINPNQGERLDRKFSFATDPEAVDSTPRQVMPKPGTYVLGQPTEDRPATLLEPMMQTAEELRQKYMPDSTIILSNEQLLTDTALGWHYSMGDKMHMIVPAVLRKMNDPSKFNVNTQAGVFYNFTHEFGHALMKDRFYTGVKPDTAVKMMNESKFGPVTDQTIADLPSDIAAIVREYNTIRARINDGSMTAEEFTKVWLGPAKLGRNFLKDIGVAPTDTALAAGRAIARRATEKSRIRDEISQKELHEKFSEDIFSLDEYLAEQMSRHAYSRKLDQATPLGRFLKKGLDSLRQFFTGAKAEGLIAPGVAFGEWLDGLPHISRLADEARQVVETKKKAGKRKVKTPAKKLPKGVVAPEDLMAVAEKKASRKAKRVKKVEHVEKSKGAAIDWQKKAKGMTALLVKDGTLEKGDPAHNALLDHIEGGERGEFLDLMREITGKTVKFEIDERESSYSVSVAKGGNQTQAAKEAWSKQKFSSGYFKAWFGDWESDPGAASVVRVGNFRSENDGSLTTDNKEPSPPLILFMARERLAVGNNVFHASTLRGAHFLESQLGEVTSSDTVPVVLNIKKPYVVADTMIAAPPTAELLAQGYDGIVYRNTFEGDISFVVFNPEQVKVVDDRAPYPRNSGVSLELDYDQATPEGRGAARLFRGMKNFLGNPGPLRRSFRSVLGALGAVQQMQQLAHMNPDLTDLAFFTQTNTNLETDSAKRKVVANNLLETWEGDISHKDQDRINKLLIEEFEGREHWFELYQGVKKNEQGKDMPWYQLKMNDRAKQELKKRGIDVDTEQGSKLGKFVLDVKNSLMDKMNEDEQILHTLLAHRHASSLPVMQANQRRVRKAIHEARKVPFFPQGRFGNYVITVKTKRAKGPGYETVWREAFEKKSDWEKAHQRIKAKAAPGDIVEPRILSDKVASLMSLPAEFIDTVSSELGLSDAQRDQLEAILMPMKQEKLLRTYDRTKAAVKGYSSDAMRSYADYMWHHSNAQSKLLYGPNFGLAISHMKDQLTMASRSGDLQNVERMTRAVKAMEKTKDYVLDPPNEWQKARAVVSLAYLGLNVKTALLNLYGLVTVQSDMVGKFGLAKAQVRFARATKMATQTMMLQPRNLDVRRAGNYLPPLVQKGVDLAIEQGVLSQSYAYALAGMATSRSRERMRGLGAASRMTQRAVDLGMYPFRLTELMTRRISFIAALEEHLQANGENFKEAYDKAVAQTNLLQNDYSAGNRVPWMRGGRGLLGPVIPMATIFMSFAQHMAWHGYGGYELGLRRKRAEAVKEGTLPESQMPQWYQWGYGYTARIWLLTLLAAGYEGLPGAEDILDLIDIAWRKIGKKPIRQELREMVEAIGGDPVQWSRGLAHNVGGFDISRSVGFGDLVPGTDVLSRSGNLSPEELAGNFALGLLGPTGGLIKTGLAIVGSDKPMAQTMQKLPGGIGNLWNAYTWSTDGVRGPNDAEITFERDANGKIVRIRELNAVEIGGKALGFQPEIVSKNREILWQQYDAKIRWQSERAFLKRNFNHARDRGDVEAEKEARRAIADFNAWVKEDEEFKAMAIGNKELMVGYRQHRTRKRNIERGKVSRRERGVAEGITDSFSEGESSP